MSKPNVRINKFVSSTFTATELLIQAKLYGQLIVVIYSAIDAMGLLMAAPEVTRATRATFKSWVKEYMLPDSDLDVNEDDLYAARCSVLHTFTTISDESNKGNARQIQYVSYPNGSLMGEIVREVGREIDNGVHVVVRIESFYIAFLKGMKKFTKDMSLHSEKDGQHQARVDNILQLFCF